MKLERGTALIEILVIGFAVALAVLPVLSVVARLADGHATVHAVARDGAVWVARHGSEPPPVDSVEVSLREEADGIEVVAESNIALIGVGGVTVTRLVRSTVRVPVSPYRSEP